MDEGQHGVNGGPSSRVVRCGIYTRKSTEEGLSQPFNSLDAQREAAEAYIASQRGQGWRLIPTRYDDGGFSGGSLERPALQQLLADIDHGRVDCVVVYKVDRLSRSLLDFARIMERFDQRSVNFVSITQQFNTTTSLGRLTLHILLSFAQFEREIISERTRDKLSAARRKGKWVGGTPPLGYDVAPERGRLIINEAEASQVREIFALYACHRGLIPVVEELNHRGWRTKHWTSQSGRWHPGQPFGKQALVAILKNVTYTGRVNYKGTIYPGEQPAVVDELLWQRVNEQLLSRGFPACHSCPKDALLKGLLRCEPCGASMILSQTSTRGRSYRYYVCMNAQRRGWAACPTKSVQATLIEHSVVAQLSSFWPNTKAREPDPAQQACYLREVVERIVVDGGTGRVTVHLKEGQTPLSYRLEGIGRSEAVGRHVPRVKRLMALALKCEDLVRKGTVRDYAELARLGWVSRARVSQIRSLLELAAPIQEQILELSAESRDAISERALRRLTRVTAWSEQMELWRKLQPPTV